MCLCFLTVQSSEMDSGEAHAQRPVTLDITVEDVNQEALAPAPPESITGQTPPTDDNLPQDDSIDLGREFATPTPQDSSTTPSESLVEKLNDQMMESVMISDSPTNSEEDDVPIDSLLDGGEENTAEENQKEQIEIRENTTEIKVSVEEREEGGSQEKPEEEAVAVVSPKGDMSPSDHCSEEAAQQSTKVMKPKDEPVPVCTIFSQGTQPKSLVPDGFQPTLIKSPSFSMGTGGDEAVTPSKMGVPLVCQPSPSLSKFFTDNGQANPASDFFDSFTAPSSFISVSNPNAEIPPGPAHPPDRQLSSTSSSISTPGGPLDSGAPTPSSVFAPPEPSPKAQPLTPQPALAPGSTPTSAQATPPQPFNQLFSGSDDPFATALSLNEVDRRHDAWLPCEETRKVLISVATQQYSPAYLESSRLTMPGLKFDNLQVGYSFRSEYN